MKLETVKITNFRGISECAEVNFKDLTAIVGKNDVGKSTILEALDIFFNGNSAESKLGAMDINQYVRKKCDGKIDIEIACVFSDIPQGDIVLDDSASTSLNNEGLAVDGKLEIVKIYPNAGKAKVYVRAKYPNVGGAENLFLCKNTDLTRLSTFE